VYPRLRNNGMTMIMATHQIGFASSCKRIVFMKMAGFSSGGRRQDLNQAECARPGNFAPNHRALRAGDTLSMEECSTSRPRSLRPC